MNKKTILISAFFVSLTACSNHQQNLSSIDTANISQLESVQVSASQHTDNPDGLSALRSRSLKDTAMSIGAQGGLAYTATEIDVWLEKDKKYLDSIFNFSAMMLEHGVLPPVLETGDNNLNLADADTIRVADRRYRIVQQAKFSTTPPNWRDYLYMNYTKPILPDRTLLPRNTAEHKVWRDGIRAGWDKGIEQGYIIFQQNMARLKRDYRGMMLYRKLLTSKMISAPYVARTEMGVTGDGNDMRINDQILRIVEHPQLQTNSKGWKAVVIKNRGLS